MSELNYFLILVDYFVQVLELVLQFFFVGFSPLYSLNQVPELYQQELILLMLDPLNLLGQILCELHGLFIIRRYILLLHYFMIQLIPKISRLARLARYDRPVGALYLFWPCFWGLAAKASFQQLIFWTPAFFIGSVAMRSFGCIINDIFDRDIDIQVSRTKNRVLASGEVSLNQAIIMAVINAGCGLWLLSCMKIPQILIAFSVIPVVAVYPLTKRKVKCPQLVLGSCYNWGVLVSAQTITDFGCIECLPLYMSGVCWTLIYDTLYAVQDREDDRKIKINSSALLFQGKQLKLFSSLSLLSLGFTVAYAIQQNLHHTFFIPLLALSHLWMLWSASKAMRVGGGFQRLHWFGLMLGVGLILARYQINQIQ